MSTHKAAVRAHYEGIARGPGKFEGCTPYEVYAWLNDPEPYDDPEVEEQNWREYCQFNGWDPDNLPDWVDEDEERALYDEGRCLNFRWVPGRTEFMDISDWHIFPELYNVEYIDLWEDDNGFVYAQCKTYRDNFTVSPLVGLEVRLDLTEDTSYRMTRITLVREDGTRNWYRLRNTQQVEALIARIKGLHLKEACWNWQSVTVVYSK